MRRVLILAFLLLSPTALRAQVPQTMNYQGMLTDGGGVPIPDGPHDITVRLYTVDAGGAAFFTETHPAVPVTRGYFSLLVGSVAPLIAPFSAQYWMGIQVDADPEAAPRVKLASSPYALMSKSVVDDAITSFKIAPNTIVADDIATGGVTTAEILDGTVTAADLGTGSVAGVEILDGSVQSIDVADEPGAASAASGLTSLAMGTDVWTLILSRSITVPAAGYVLALGSLQAQADHVNGATSSAEFGVSNVPDNFPETQDVGLVFPAANPTATFVLPVTVHALLPVTAGTHTFYFLGIENSGTFTLWDRQLTLVYLPTAYGSVTPLAPTASSTRTKPGDR